MASTLRSMNRISLSSLRLSFSKVKTVSGTVPRTKGSIFESVKTATTADTGVASRPVIRPPRILSRYPVELGSCDGGSLYPLHNAVAGAKLTSRLSLTSQSCRDHSQGTLCRTSPGL